MNPVSKKLRKIVFTALMAALICVATMVITIPTVSCIIYYARIIDRHLYTSTVRFDTLIIAGKAKLFEELREYHFPEVEKIYEALQKGQGGKTFYSPTHKAVIKHGKVCVTMV